jgi:hypothetical protein
MHMGHYGHPGPADDHSPKRSLGDVWSIPEPWGNTPKGSMMCNMVFGTFRIIGVLTRESRKSSTVIQKFFGGFRNEFWSKGD